MGQFRKRDAIWEPRGPTTAQRPGGPKARLPAAHGPRRPTAAHGPVVIFQFFVQR